MTRRTLVIFGLLPGLLIAIAGSTLDYVIKLSYPSGASAEEQTSGLCSLAAYLFSLTGSLVHVGSFALALFSYLLLVILTFLEKDGRIASLIALTSCSVFVGLLWARSYNLYAPCFPELAQWFGRCL